ncbi:MAG TPA: hypothetical protein V6C65_27620 [Allocoleopsis sp.]
MSQLEVMQTLIEKVGRFTLDSFRSRRIPLLNLLDDVLNVRCQGKLEYTKAQAVARVKDKQHRAELLRLAVSKNLSLSEIKTKIRDLKADAEIPAARPVEQKLPHRWNEVGKRLCNSANWDGKIVNNLLDVQLLEEQQLLLAKPFVESTAAFTDQRRMGAVVLDLSLQLLGLAVLALQNAAPPACRCCLERLGCFGLQCLQCCL